MFKASLGHIYEFRQSWATEQDSVWINKTKWEGRIRQKESKGGEKPFLLNFNIIWEPHTHTYTYMCVYICIYMRHEFDLATTFSKPLIATKGYKENNSKFGKKWAISIPCKVLMSRFMGISIQSKAWCWCGFYSHKQLQSPAPGITHTSTTVMQNGQGKTKPQYIYSFPSLFAYGWHYLQAKQEQEKRTKSQIKLFNSNQTVAYFKTT